MKIKMRIYEWNGNKDVIRTFHREYDDNDIIRFVRHALVEENLDGCYDIDIDKIEIE